MLQIFVVATVSFGPFVGYVIRAGDEAANPMIAYALLGLGVVYFPMAILAVVILGYTGALSPHIVLPAIFRGGWIYWLGVTLLLLLYFIGAVVEDIFSGHIMIGHLITHLPICFRVSRCDSLGTAPGLSPDPRGLPKMNEEGANRRIAFGCVWLLAVLEMLDYPEGRPNGLSCS